MEKEPVKLLILKATGVASAPQNHTCNAGDYWEVYSLPIDGHYFDYGRADPDEFQAEVMLESLPDDLTRMGFDALWETLKGQRTEVLKVTAWDGSRVPLAAVMVKKSVWNVLSAPLPSEDRWFPPKDYQKLFEQKALEIFNSKREVYWNLFDLGHEYRSLGSNAGVGGNAAQILLDEFLRMVPDSPRSKLILSSLAELSHVQANIELLRRSWQIPSGAGCQYRGHLQSEFFFRQMAEIAARDGQEDDRRSQE